MDITTNVIKTIGLYLFLLTCGFILGGIVQSSQEEKVVTSTLKEIQYESYVEDLSEWQILQLAMIKRESEFNPLAKNGEYLGILQEGKQFVDQCNKIVGESRWTYLDAFIPDKALAMFDVYQGYFNPSHSVTKAITVHNPLGTSYGQKVLENVKYIKEYEHIRKLIIENGR